MHLIEETNSDQPIIFMFVFSFFLLFCRPNTRRKRKFKRMAVEYETTPSTPGNSNSSSIFPVVGSAVLKKRVIKHTSQENYR